MPTLTLQPGAAAGIDDWINESSGDDGRGISGVMRVGNNATPKTIRGLLKFDISALPTGATLTSAILTLYCSSEAAAADEDIGLHKSLVQWYEGDSNGAPPGGDGSTWNNRNHNGPVAWAGGVGGASGTEWTAGATATTTITAASAFYTWDVLADVNSWYGGANNYGWWLINTDEVNASTYKDFNSSDSGNAAQRPKLVVEYALATGGKLLPDHYFHHRRLHR